MNRNKSVYDIAEQMPGFRRIERILFQSGGNLLFLFHDQMSDASDLSESGTLADTANCLLPINDF
jgi:hypothetical protein